MEEGGQPHWGGEESKWDKIFMKLKYGQNRAGPPEEATFSRLKRPQKVRCRLNKGAETEYCGQGREAVSETRELNAGRKRVCGHPLDIGPSPTPFLPLSKRRGKW